MESKELEDLHQRINSMQSEIDQQKALIKDYDSRLKGIKGDLYSQEHRFINSWLNLLSHFKNKEKEYFKEKLSAVVQGFLPGTKSTIVIGGSIIGLLTIVLMYQSNQLMLLQNQYLQKQIYIQANSDRRDQLINIMEKLYEPFDQSASQEEATFLLKEIHPIQPKYNAQTRGQSVIAYLNIQHNPLEEVHEHRLNSIYSVSISLWNSLWGESFKKSQENNISCDNYDEKNLRNVKLSYAILSDVNLTNSCFRYANFFKARLIGASFSRSDLYKADLEFSNLDRASMSEANFQEARFKFSSLRRAFANKSNFHGANFVMATMTGSIMIKSDLTSANFSGAELEGATFTHSKLKDTVFKNANILSANFSGAEDLTCDQLMSAKNWKLAVTDLKCEK